MSNIKIYTIDRKKMIKIGEEGYKKDQEQAKTYYNKIIKDNKSYNVEISDKNIMNTLFSFVNINKDSLENNNYILISVKYMDNDDFLITYYYYSKKWNNVTHYTVSCYNRNESDYKKAKIIVDYINSVA